MSSHSAYGPSGAETTRIGGYPKISGMSDKPTRTQVLEAVQIFVSETGMSEDAFGRAATKDGKLVGRLKAGLDLNSKTIDRIYAFMAQERARLAGEAAEMAARLGGNGAGDAQGDEP